MTTEDYPEIGETVRVIGGTLRIRGEVAAVEPDRDYIWLRVRIGAASYEAPYTRAEVERDPR